MTPVYTPRADLSKRRWEEARERLAIKKHTVPGEISNDQVAEEIAFEEKLKDNRAQARQLVRARRADRERGPYYVGSRHSFFRDLARDQIARQTLLADDGAAVERGDPLPSEHGGTLEDARARLATVSEQRDVTSGDPGAAAFTPAHGPSFVGEEFATALRARGVMPNILRVRPLPDGGKTVDVPRFQVGATASVQATEGPAVSETDIDGETYSALKVPISGQSDISIQGYEFAGPEFDAALAADLGAAVAAALESQIINGSGSSGQMTGLLNLTGRTAVSRAQASPTAATNYSGVGDLVSQTATAYGAPLDTLLLHPRRRAFIDSELGHAPNWLGLQVAVVNSIPTTINTNQDAPIVIPSQEIILYLGQPRFRVLGEVLSGTLQVRAQAVLTAALVAGRKPAAVGVSTGTEWAPPSF
jgi:HK97 family phage major capsid protein